jgi:Zn/Cd-binding protein ZinT
MIRKTVSLVAIAASVTVLATGCETKVSQCNKIATVSNAASTEFAGMEKELKANPMEAFKKSATRLDQYIKDMNAVEVKDEKLVGYKGRFTTMYTEFRDGSLAIVSAVQAKDSKALATAVTKIQQSAQQETSLISEVKQYCGAK